MLDPWSSPVSEVLGSSQRYDPSAQGDEARLRAEIIRLAV
jgi:hypothetical protein